MRSVHLLSIISDHARTVSASGLVPVHRKTLTSTSGVGLPRVLLLATRGGMRHATIQAHSVVADNVHNIKQWVSCGNSIFTSLHRHILVKTTGKFSLTSADSSESKDFVWEGNMLVFPPSNASKLIFVIDVYCGLVWSTLSASFCQILANSIRIDIEINPFGKECCAQ